MHKLYFLPIGLVVLTVLGYGLWRVPQALVVKHIECYTQFGPCPENYYPLLDSLKNRSILAPLPRQSLGKEFAVQSQVDSVELYRRLPDTVVASVKLRKAIGVIGSQVLGAVDERGVVISEAVNSSLPQLVYDQDFQTGDQLPANYVNGLQILAKVCAIVGERCKGKLEGKTLTVYLATETQILVDISQPFETQGSSLQAIFTRSRIEGKRIKKLDLRYLNPVVVY